MKNPTPKVNKVPSYRSGINKGLPKSCECGGKMEYDHSFGRVWSVCKKCSPVVHIKVSKGLVVP